MKRLTAITGTALAVTLLLPIAVVVMARADDRYPATGTPNRLQPQVPSPNGIRGKYDDRGTVRVETGYSEITDSRTGQVRRIPTQTRSYLPYTQPVPTAGFAPLTFQSQDSLATEDIRTRFSQTSDETEREALKKEMHDLLSTEFDAMHARQEDEIKGIQERLEKIQSLHAKRTENKERIIERRMETVLGTPSDLQWNLQSTGPIPPNGIGNSGFTQSPDEQHSSGMPSQLRPVTPPEGPYHPFETRGSFLPSQAVPPAYNPNDLRGGWFNVPAPAPTAPPAVPSLNPNLPSFDRSTPPQSDPNFPPPADTPQLGDLQINQPLKPEASQSPGARIFDIHRNMSTRKGELKLAEIKLVQTKQLREKGAVPFTDLQAVEGDVERLKKLIAIDEQEMEWLLESQQQVIQESSEILARDLKKVGSDLSPQAREDVQRKIESAKKLLDLIKKLSPGEVE